jgi:hypothetical protein
MRRRIAGCTPRWSQKRDFVLKWKITHLQILARMSPLPVAKILPEGLGATEMTGSVSNDIQKRAPKFRDRQADLPEFL